MENPAKKTDLLVGKKKVQPFLVPNQSEEKVSTAALFLSFPEAKWRHCSLFPFIEVHPIYIYTFS